MKIPRTRFECNEPFHSIPLCSNKGAAAFEHLLLTSPPKDHRRRRQRNKEEADEIIGIGKIEPGGNKKETIWRALASPSQLPHSVIRGECVGEYVCFQRVIHDRRFREILLVT